ncbi:hypothetical protein SLEP1_g60173, partial [Rubroshorea leprosula]
EKNAAGCTYYRWKSKRMLLVALTIDSKTSMSAFFVVDSSATYNALLGRDWIHLNWCVPSTLHQRLIFWNGGKTEVVQVDSRPFLANSNMVEARYYDEDVGTICFFGMDKQGRSHGITTCNKPTLAKYVVDERAMNAIFYDMIGRFMEIYIDEVVVKSIEEEEHLEHLRKAFDRM